MMPEQKAMIHDAVWPETAAPASQRICHPCHLMLEPSFLVHVLT